MSVSLSFNDLIAVIPSAELTQLKEIRRFLNEMTACYTISQYTHLRVLISRRYIELSDMRNKTLQFIIASRGQTNS